MNSYKPPSVRKADPLSAENYPALSAAAKTRSPQLQMNFLKQIQEAEAARKAAAEAAEAAALNTGLETMSYERLKKEGWEVLSLAPENVLRCWNALSSVSASQEELD